MYNEVTHDFIPLELPNIVYASKKGITLTLVSHPFLQPLLIKLAKARPKWRLIGTGFQMRDEGPQWVNRFTVFEGNAELGTIKRDYSVGLGQDVFSIDNTRMSNKRQRGSSTTTKDVNKAFKIVTKEFYGKTPEELLKEAKQGLASKIYHNVRSRHTHHEALVENMQPGLLAFAVANWDKFKDFVMAEGLVAAVNIDRYHESKEDHDAARALQAASVGDTPTGMTVVLRGSEYLIGQGGEYKILSNDELTPHMKRCIGMLKLAESSTFIPGMGVRGDGDTMFIMPEDTQP